MRALSSPNLTTPTALSSQPSLGWILRCGGALLIASSGVASGVLVAATSARAQEAPLNPILEVGVVQRFGAEPGNEMVLKPLSGDNITLKFKAEEQVQSITTTGEVKVEVEMQPLPEPKVTERVVLSTHRSFESAEDSATNWQEQGIEVEVAQPKQWQVWAKRDTYKTPLLRRLLMQNLQSHGLRTAFIDTQVQQQAPQAAVVVNGTRYLHDEMEFDSTTDQIEVKFNREQEEARLYAGSLKLQPNAYNTYTLVNHVPIETYLRGVVPHEIGLAAPPTTIEAQAILARTYALRNLRRFTVDNYQLCADTQCQVYWGLRGAAPESDRAIAATRGKVLTYQNELVDALYSSTTGGITAPFSNVWNGPDRPYLQAVIDSVQNAWDLSQQSLAEEQNFRSFIGRKQGFNEVGWEMFRWRVESPMAEITKDLRTYLQSKQHPLANFTTVENLKVVERSPAGRVQKMQIVTDRGLIELEKDEILRALYAPNSTLFYLDPIYATSPPSPSPPTVPTPTGQAGSPSPAPAPTTANLEGTNSDQSPTTGLESSRLPAPTPLVPSPATKVLKGFAFVGGGLGHGVGMSQTGAYHLGKIGWSNAQILNFYYPGTQISLLNPTITFWREPARNLVK